MTDLTLNRTDRGAAAPLVPDTARLQGRARIAAWAMQLVAVAILAMTLPFKYTAAEETVRLFDTLGAGAAGRLGTAVMETLAVALLLVPRTAAVGAALTVGLMTGAILSHVLVLGIVWDGDASLFTMAVVAYAAGLGALWLRRRELPLLGPRLG